MARIFISYAMEDGKEAGELHRLLSLFGFDCFLAHKDIRKGEQWREAIVKAIRTSDVFIPLLSDHGLTSAWVQQECGMAHILAEGRKHKPAIIPVVPNGTMPPGCLSEYQASSVRKTFWASKLALDANVASVLGGSILEHVSCLEEIKPRAIAHLTKLTIEDFANVLGFLQSFGRVTFNDFLSVIKHADAHSGAYRSDSIMTHIYALLRVHIEELKKHPDWVVVWNRFHNRHEQFTAEERRRHEEYMRKLQEQIGTTDKGQSSKDRP